MAQAWRLLPPDWPAWQSVYYYLRKWRRDGTLERIHTLLREYLRIALGRDPQPSAGSVDSQSVKTTSVEGERGYDGAKKLVGTRNDHTLRLWDVASGEPLHLLKGHSESVDCCAFTADGSLLASASSDHTLRLWELQRIGAKTTAHVFLERSDKLDYSTMS